MVGILPMFASLLAKCTGSPASRADPRLEATYRRLQGLCAFFARKIFDLLNPVHLTNHGASSGGNHGLRLRWNSRPGCPVVGKRSTSATKKVNRWVAQKPIFLGIFL